MVMKRRAVTNMKEPGNIWAYMLMVLVDFLFMALFGILAGLFMALLGVLFLADFWVCAALFVIGAFGAVGAVVYVSLRILANDERRP